MTVLNSIITTISYNSGLVTLIIASNTLLLYQSYELLRLFEVGLSDKACDAALVGEQVIPRLGTGTDDHGQVSEEPVGEAPILQTEPYAFDRIQLERLRRQMHKANGRGLFQVSADVPFGLVHDANGVNPRGERRRE